MTPITHAIILVGGRGTRLQPLTDTRPKPMLPIGDLPFLEHQLAHLYRHGVRNVTFACGFLPSLIISRFGDGESVGMSLNYVVEPEPLDTGGAIAFAARTLDPQRLLVCNGDILSDLDIDELTKVHERAKATGTIALTPVEDPTRYGLVRTDENGRVTAFVEKPPADEVDTNLINAGTYVLEPSVIDLVPDGVRCNVEREIFPQLVGHGLYAHAAHGYWNDIGTFPSYRAAQVALLDGRVTGAGFWSNAHDSGADRSYIAKDAAVAPSVRVEHPVSVGAGAIVESGSVIGPHAVIGRCAHIGPGTRVRRAVVMEETHIGRDAQVVDAIVGEGARIEDGCSITDGAVVAPGAVESRPVVRG